MKKLCKSLINKFINFILKPEIRYRSPIFRRMRDAICYSEVEKIMDAAMGYLRANRIEGDYLEFGVFTGRSFVTAYHLAKSFEHDKMRFFAFDSFEGLPESESAKDFERYEKGGWTCGLDQFKKNLQASKVPENDYAATQGFFKHTLNLQTKEKHELKKAALIMIDSDLYESAVEVLDFCTDLIQEGTMIIFDEWFAYRANPEKGEQKAFREWLAKNNFGAVQMYWHRRSGNSFIIHPK